ncbi:hypothetical protein ACVGXQ_03455, partial [Enterobacter intestinihominis]
LMGLSPLAPAWYVLALSLMGLVLGMWLRQSEGCGARPPRPTHGQSLINNYDPTTKQKKTCNPSSA